MKIETFSAEETYALGKKLGSEAKPGDVLTLIGDLGVGKTVFTQGFAHGLGITEPISSPTFTIVQVYEEGRLPFYHFDVYRIGDIEEMDEIGYEDYFYGSGVTMIEWANLIEEILPQDYQEVQIEKDLEKGFDYRTITIWQGIQRERLMLMGLRDRADYVIDTTDMLPQKLRSTIRGLFATGSERKGLAVTVYSFGFKHGAPYDADLVMDVRFLPNPYYDPELRPLTGLDAPVRDFVRMREETIEFEQKWHDLLDVVMPGYVAEGKQQLAIGVGCTGGQHRSVALAEATGDYLKSKGYRVSVAHRDLRLAERGHDVQRESDNVLDARAGGGKEA